MNIFLYRWPTRWALSMGLALSISLAHAQTTAVAATTQPDATATLLQYRSVFAQYQGLSDQPVAAWADTNATVEKIGGWRVYAKEAREPDTAEKTDQATHMPTHQGAHGEHGRKP